MTTKQAGARQAEEGLARFLRGEISGWDLVERPTISSVSILLTYQCPAACAHCVFQSDMTRSETVGLEEAAALIEAAARQNPPPALGFSGGEPFLQLSMMTELARLAQDRGMVWEVISSSAWCGDYAHARETLSRLQALGLRTYCTSVDRFHTASVAPRRMRDALKAALDLGLRAVINTMSDAQSCGREKEYLADALDLPVETIAQCRINSMRVVSVGRARTRVRRFRYPDKDFREGCPYATDVVSLSPLGLLYPCCGMVVGEDPGRAALFVQGSIRGKSVTEVAALLEEVKSDLFFKLLQTLGPYRLLQMMKIRRPDLRTRDRYVGSCDVCLEFSRLPRLAAATREALAEWAELLAQPEPKRAEKRARPRSSPR